MTPTITGKKYLPFITGEMLISSCLVNVSYTKRGERSGSVVDFEGGGTRHFSQYNYKCLENIN